MPLRKCTSLSAGAAKPPAAPPCGVLPKLFYPAGVSAHFLRFILLLHTIMDATFISCFFANTANFRRINLSALPCHRGTVFRHEKPPTPGPHPVGIFAKGD